MCSSLIFFWYFLFFFSFPFTNIYQGFLFLFVFFSFPIYIFFFFCLYFYFLSSLFSVQISFIQSSKQLPLRRKLRRQLSIYVFFLCFLLAFPIFPFYFSFICRFFFTILLYFRYIIMLLLLSRGFFITAIKILFTFSYIFSTPRIFFCFKIFPFNLLKCIPSRSYPSKLFYSTFPLIQEFPMELFFSTPSSPVCTHLRPQTDHL